MSTYTIAVSFNDAVNALFEQLKKANIAQVCYLGAHVHAEKRTNTGTSWVNKRNTQEIPEGNFITRELFIEGAAADKVLLDFCRDTVLNAEEAVDFYNSKDDAEDFIESMKHLMKSCWDRYDAALRRGESVDLDEDYFYAKSWIDECGVEYDPRQQQDKQTSVLSKTINCSIRKEHSAAN